MRRAIEPGQDHLVEQRLLQLDGLRHLLDRIERVQHHLVPHRLAEPGVADPLEERWVGVDADVRLQVRPPQRAEVLLGIRKEAAGLVDHRGGRLGAAVALDPHDAIAHAEHGRHVRRDEDSLHGLIISGAARSANISLRLTNRGAASAELFTLFDG